MRFQVGELSELGLPRSILVFRSSGSMELPCFRLVGLAVVCGAPIVPFLAAMCRLCFEYVAERPADCPYFLLALEGQWGSGCKDSYSAFYR